MSKTTRIDGAAVIEWAREHLCDLTEHRRPPVSKPAWVEVDGKPWTAASDGSALLAVLGKHVETPADDISAAVVRGLLAGALRGRKTGALWAFVGGADPIPERGDPEPCPDCNGRTVVTCICDCGDEHKADCYKCDGDGTVEPDEPVRPVRRGRIHGRVFNLNLIASALEPVHGEPVRLKVDKERRVLRLDGDGWRAAIKGLYDEGQEAPSWPEPAQ